MVDSIMREASHMPLPISDTFPMITRVIFYTVFPRTSVGREKNSHPSTNGYFRRVVFIFLFFICPALEVSGFGTSGNGIRRNASRRSGRRRNGSRRYGN